ncbi:MAG: hypothetical protein HZC40_17800 [Chloroflexi bacterium]|nr:hypothetical protein [Chloroflexota bacterium]
MEYLSGIITNHTPFISARVKNGRLVFAKRGTIRFVVDTGFTGDLLIPSAIINHLDLKFLAYKTFHLAADQVIALPVYRGEVMFDRAILEVEMTPGDALIGMSLMQAIGSQLILDFDRAQVRLSA